MSSLVFNPKLRNWLALAVLSAPVAAAAQNSLTSFNRPAITAIGFTPLEVFTEDRDVLQIYAGGETEYHSNLFALPDGVSPQASYGSTSRSDIIYRGLVGVSFDRQVSLQRYRFDASVLPVKYTEYSNYDFVGYSLGGHWDWSVGRPWFGTLGARIGSGETPFGNYYENAKNIEKRARIYASGGFRFTPSWGAFIGVDSETLDNSYSGVSAADYQFISTESGLKYAPGTGTEVDFVWRFTDGEYPNRQVFDEFGNILPSTVDNKFKQDALLVRLQLSPSDDTRIGGNVGYTTRSYETLSERDFSGPTAGLFLDWRPSGAFRIRAELARDIQSEELLTASYADLTTIRLFPSVQLTGKITLLGQAVFSRISYKGDPGYSSSGAAVRDDDLRILGIGAGYEFSRTISANLLFRRTQRESNYDQYDYSDDVVTANVLLRF